MFYAASVGVDRDSFVARSGSRRRARPASASSSPPGDAPRGIGTAFATPRVGIFTTPLSLAPTVHGVHGEPSKTHNASVGRRFACGAGWAVRTSTPKPRTSNGFPHWRRLPAAHHASHSRRPPARIVRVSLTLPRGFFLSPRILHGLSAWRGVRDSHHSRPTRSLPERVRSSSQR